MSPLKVLMQQTVRLHASRESCIKRSDCISGKCVACVDCFFLSHRITVHESY